MPQRIENAHEKGYEADKKNIWKGNSCEKNCKFIFNPRAPKTKGLDSHNPWREQDAQQCDNRQHNGEKGQHDSGKLKGILFCLLTQVLSKNRDKGNSEGPLRKEAP